MVVIDMFFFFRLTTLVLLFYWYYTGIESNPIDANTVNTIHVTGLTKLVNSICNNFSTAYAINKS